MSDLAWLSACLPRRKLLNLLRCKSTVLFYLIAAAIFVFVSTRVYPWKSPHLLVWREMPPEEPERVAWNGRTPWAVADVATWKDDRLACVTLTFDDGSWSAITGIEELLTQNNIQATYYIITNSLHVKSPEYTDELKKLLSHGHEIGSHTHGHRALWDKSRNRPATDIQEQVELSVRTLYRAFGSKLGGPLTFSYPFGEGSMSEAVQRYLRANGFIAARTIAQGVNSAHTDNMMRLKAFPLTSFTPFHSLKWYIERVIKNGRAGLDLTWCVFFGHGARLPPYRTDEDAGYEPMKDEDIKALIKLIADQARAGDIWPATMRDAALYVTGRENTGVNVLPLKAKEYPDASHALCLLMQSDAGVRRSRRQAAGFMEMTSRSGCLEWMQRQLQVGNFLIVDILAHYTGPSSEPSKTDANGQPIPRRRAYSAEITICASISLDMLEDDTSFYHRMFSHGPHLRSWFCEAILDDVEFSASCTCRLVMDDGSKEHHDDNTRHVYTHRHRHGELENARVRCCYSQMSAREGTMSHTRMMISSLSGHVR